MNILKKIIVKILTIESRIILAKYKPFVVAITGSVGKTSTKDAIFCVLKNSFRYARKSEKSMNSEIGLPLTVIGVPNAWRSFGGWMKNILIGFKVIFLRSEYPDCLVLEIGADHPGDISSVSKWLRSDIVIITKVSRTPVHVEFFKSPEQVFIEKASLVDSLKDDGCLILYADDDRVASLGEKVKSKNTKVLTYGIENPATARGLDAKISYLHGDGSTPVGMNYVVDLTGDKFDLHVRHVLGKVYMYPLLAAVAVGKAHNIPVNDIHKSLNLYEPPRGRLNIIQGIKDSIIIDDTYNSSPDAVISAFEAISGIDTNGARIAILGDMMELGKHSSNEHRRIGKEVVKYCNKLFTVGMRSEATAREAIANGMNPDLVKSYENSREAAKYVVDSIKTGDIILVKGSQSMRMERVVSALLKNPEKADRLLVRQEKEWLALSSNG